MTETEKRVLEFVALATAANNNCCTWRGELRLASSAKVAELLAKLEAFKPRGKTYEVPPVNGRRLVRQPAPWLRRQLALAR